MQTLESVLFFHLRFSFLLSFNEVNMESPSNKLCYAHGSGWLCLYK